MTEENTRQISSKVHVYFLGVLFYILSLLVASLITYYGRVTSRRTVVILSTGAIACLLFVLSMGTDMYMTSVGDTPDENGTDAIWHLFGVML